MQVTNLARCRKFEMNIKQHLEDKVAEQIELTNREAYLATRAATTRSNKLRLKYYTDRQLVGTRLSRVNNEIMELVRAIKT